MNVKLEIANDEELRAHIKDVIKGQVLGIAREEYLSILTNELGRLTKNASDSYIQTLVREVTVKYATDIMRRMDINKLATEIFNPIITDALNKVLVDRDWSAVINKLATDKIKNLLDKK